MHTSYENVTTWNESSLSGIPKRETDQYEYKSSLIRNDKKFSEKLKEDICTAASAFWNTGGGFLIVGIDGKTATVDGGIPAKSASEKGGMWCKMGA
jgi:predicted HTH transcriptional regulator